MLYLQDLFKDPHQYAHAPLSLRSARPVVLFLLKKTLDIVPHIPADLMEDPLVIHAILRPPRFDPTLLVHVAHSRTWASTALARHPDWFVHFDPQLIGQHFLPQLLAWCDPNPDIAQSSRELDTLMHHVQRAAPLTLQHIHQYVLEHPNILRTVTPSCARLVLLEYPHLARFAPPPLLDHSAFMHQLCAKDPTSFLYASAFVRQDLSLVHTCMRTAPQLKNALLHAHHSAKQARVLHP